MEIVCKCAESRYAHLPGYTYCLFLEQKELVVTCGMDGDARIWEGVHDDDPKSFCLGTSVRCVAQFNNKILSCVGNNCLLYSFPNFTVEKTIFPFSSSATFVKSNAQFIAASSENGIIKVAKTDDLDDIFELTKDSNSIVNIDLSVKNLLASFSANGKITIWDLLKRNEMKTINFLSENTRLEKKEVVGTVCFEPKTGDTLIYCDKNEIVVVECKTWNTQRKLINDDILDNEYTCCAFSSCGKYLAAGTTKGEFSIWNFTEKRRPPQTTTTEEKRSITSISWNPKNSSMFAYCDVLGRLGSVKYTESNDSDIGSPIKTASVFSGSDSEDGSEDDEQSERSAKAVKKIVPHHVSFQPGQTEIFSDKKYLVWNTVGIITAHDNSPAPGVGSIHVEFHDASTHFPFVIKNDKYCMASMSSSAVALASRNKLLCVTLSEFRRSEWSINFSNEENITAIATNKKLIAVAVNESCIRFYGVMGTQREVINLPGRVVAMNVFGESTFIVVYSKTYYLCMSALIISLEGSSKLKSREISDLPIFKDDVSLKWVGFSDKASPCIFNSNGELHLYHMSTNLWYPVFKNNKSMDLYVIDVLEESNIVQGVLCSNATLLPVTPKPIVSIFEMQIPLIETPQSLLEEKILRLSMLPSGNIEDFNRTVLKLFATLCKLESEQRATELVEFVGVSKVVKLTWKYALKTGRIHLAENLAKMIEQETEDVEDIEHSIDNSRKRKLNDSIDGGETSMSKINKNGN